MKNNFKNIVDFLGLKKSIIGILSMVILIGMVADAARAFKPLVLYPYHFGETDCSRLVTLLKNEKGIEVRIRKMK